MGDQLGALGLVLNCVTLWNTGYASAALDQLRAQGHPAREEDAARLSVYQWHPGQHVTGAGCAITIRVSTFLAAIENGS
jgi:hypothetical protein